MINLPPPRMDGNFAVEAAINLRRSIRAYSEEPVTMQDLSQLLWAGQGIIAPNGRRTAPSAGALYPLEIYLAAGLVPGIEPGVYHYIPQQHGLDPVRFADQRAALAATALGQDYIATAPVCLIIGAVYKRTSIKYGTRARRYVHMEAGHAAQNILLQATALQLSGVVVGAFDDQAIQQVLKMSLDHEPLSLIPIGRPWHLPH